MNVWTIYLHPHDDGFLVREWQFSKDGEAKAQPSTHHHTFDEARVVAGAIGRVRLERSPKDDPHIVESWA